MRDELSNSRYGNKYDDLTEEEQQDIKDAVPIIISIAEPEQVNK